MPRLSKSMPQTPVPPAVAPNIESIFPLAALPGGDVELRGEGLGPRMLGPRSLVTPEVLVDGLPASISMSRADRLCFRVPHNARAGKVEVRTGVQTSSAIQSGSEDQGSANSITLRVARELSDGLHPVTSPVVSRSGMTFATISGQRGKQTPVSIVRVSPDRVGTPFVSGILNPTGLAFDPEGQLYVTSRAEGTVYRIDAGGEATVYAEGMGVATGAAFDTEGNLFVGDRSGTIFKIAHDPAGKARQIFVYATLEPSAAAYHLAMGPEGILYVTAPSLSPNDCIWAIDREGSTSAWFRGLGRPQGLAVDADGNVYVAASLRGQRGLVRVTPQGKAELAVAGYNMVGVAFSPFGTAVLATNEAVYDVDLGVEGLRLF